ncbi:MAG: hypothetical protein INR73_04245 [Williamsia sp.]|nr:hypothetical protein [Williamsia sp.]
MKQVYLIGLFLLHFFVVAANNYATPGTGVKWDLDALVANAGGDVTFAAGVYNVNDTVFVSLNDTLFMATNAVVKFAANTYLDVNGTLIINPPTGVTFTAQDPASGFYGMRIDSSNTTVLRKLTFEYAVSLRLSDCSIPIDSCIFRYNSPTTTFGNGAIALFRSNPVITNCQFLNNQRAAIQGGANVNNAPKIVNCLFQGNNTLNTNVPQINLGATSEGTDTVKIIGNRILRASTNSGGIGFLPIGNVYALITGNVIRNNRYGITLNGGANINAMISYNQIDSNNTQNDPNLGGSGISFTGGTATSQQNTIVTGNLIRWNLWGITIQGRAKPDLGNLSNADTSDDGKNRFIDNTNATTPNIDLYNNTADPIFAQNNYWGTNDVGIVETKIFHQPDNRALGFVNYLNILLPLRLASFAAASRNGVVVLSWETSQERDTRLFQVERNEHGQFLPIGTVAARGGSSASQIYGFTDSSRTLTDQPVLYRLKIQDADGAFSYSPVMTIRDGKGIKTGIVKLYPTLSAAGEPWHLEVRSAKPQTMQILVADATGRQLIQVSKSLAEGMNYITYQPPAALPVGMLYISFKGEGIAQSVSLFRRP